jgi:acyl-CoA thioesterase-1
MLRRLLIMLLLLVSGAAQADRPVILVLGDSISAAWGIDSARGWVTLLQKRLQREKFNYRVVNASVSGDTTRTGLNRLDEALTEHKPDIVIVALGGNDGLRGLPFSEIDASLNGIIGLSRQQGAQVLLAGVRLPPNYGPFYNSRFETLFRELSAARQVALVPQLLAGIDERAELMQADGIHPNAAAQSLILDNVWPHLRPLLYQSAETGRDTVPGTPQQGARNSPPH